MSRYRVIIGQNWLYLQILGSKLKLNRFLCHPIIDRFQFRFFQILKFKEREFFKFFQDFLIFHGMAILNSVRDPRLMLAICSGPVVDHDLWSVNCGAPNKQETLTV